MKILRSSIRESSCQHKKNHLTFVLVAYLKNMFQVLTEKCPAEDATVK